MVLSLLGTAGAATIHLKSGNQIEVSAWREVGDEIEFVLGGGLVRIDRAEVDRIDGKPIRGDLLSQLTRPKPDAADEMRELADQALELHGAELSAAMKAQQLGELAKRWDRIAVSDAQRETYRRGQRVFRFFANILVAAGDGVPDAAQQEDVLKALRGLRAEVAASARKPAP